jgi:hypothetical protein
MMKSFLFYYSPNEKNPLSGGLDRIICIWDALTGLKNSIYNY